MSVKSVFDTLGRRPPVPEMLDWTLADFDRLRQWIKLEFKAGGEFANPSGFVHGGIIVCMLDEAMGSCILSTTDAASLPITMSLTTNYLKPTRCGHLTAEGQIQSLGKAAAFTEAVLFDSEGTPTAKATANFRLIPFDRSLIVPD